MKLSGGATPNALLGLLSLGPRSGYDLRQLVQQSIGHFWSESYGQIYPGLKRLAAGGLVEKKTRRTKGRPDRHLYSLTDAGWEQLRGWLKLPPENAVPRNELLLKLFFGAHASPSVNQAHVVSFMELHQSAVKLYEAMAKQLQREEANDPQLPYWLITLNFGRNNSAAMVKWCKETLTELKEIEFSKRGGKNARA